MGNRDDIEELFEFRIHFCHLNSDFIDNRHFTAFNPKSAVEMFEFACRKDDLEVKVVDIEKWNRWADRWEKVEDFIKQQEDLTV